MPPIYTHAPSRLGRVTQVHTCGIMSAIIIQTHSQTPGHTSPRVTQTHTTTADKPKASQTGSRAHLCTHVHTHMRIQLPSFPNPDLLEENVASLNM